jgi:dihydroneopterin aldolase
MMKAEDARISIRDLRFSAIVGVLPQERGEKQTLSCSIDIDFLFPPDHDPSRTDKIQDTVDYSDVIEDILQSGLSNSPFLLERLSRLIAEKIASRHPGIRSISVFLKKVPPPVSGVSAETIGVSITYTPENHI